MKRENKKLLLKDLYARLPYGFTIHRYSDNVNISIDDIDEFAHFLEYSEGEDFKPYLRPMDSMTEEELEEWENYIIPTNIPDSEGLKAAILYDDVEFAIDWLNSHHFDYRGLIEKGLALEAPEGMYNLNK